MNVQEFCNRISEARGYPVNVVIITEKKIPSNFQREENTVYIIQERNTFDGFFRAIVKEDEENASFVFHTEEILYCPMDNILVPEHELLEDLNEIAIYREKKLPRILFEDIVARWYGWGCNSIIKIKRKDGSIYYRHLYCSNACSH